MVQRIFLNVFFHHVKRQMFIIMHWNALLNIDNSLRTDSRSCYKRRTWYTEGHKRLLIDRHVPLVVKMQMMFPIFPKPVGKHLKLIKIESTHYTARSHWSWFNICSFQRHRLPYSFKLATSKLLLSDTTKKQTGGENFQKSPSGEILRLRLSRAAFAPRRTHSR